jgi:hypothetical protein
VRSTPNIHQKPREYWIRGQPKTVLGMTNSKVLRGGQNFSVVLSCYEEACYEEAAGRSRNRPAASLLVKKRQYIAAEKSFFPSPTEKKIPPIPQKNSCSSNRVFIRTAINSPHIFSTFENIGYYFENIGHKFEKVGRFFEKVGRFFSLFSSCFFVFL